jgi:hypothetical protein
LAGKPSGYMARVKTTLGWHDMTYGVKKRALNEWTQQEETSLAFRRVAEFLNWFK